MAEIELGFFQRRYSDLSTDSMIGLCSANQPLVDSGLVLFAKCVRTSVRLFVIPSLLILDLVELWIAVSNANGTQSPMVALLALQGLPCVFLSTLKEVTDDR